MTNPVKLFSANWLDENCAVTASSGGGRLAYLYDGKLSPQWSSSGSGQGTAETISVSFRSRWGNPVTRQIDRVLLLNTNAAAISAQWQDCAGQWHNIAECALSGITAANVLAELAAPVAARGFALTISETNPPDGEKRLGELKLCKNLADFSRALTGVSFSCKDKGGSYYLCGGKLVTWRQYRKTAASLKADNLARADRDALLAALEENLLVNLCAEDGADKTLELAQSAPPQQSYDRRTGLYSVSLELTER
ncbi:MAG: hypothetical protein WC421_03520 [Elusimicrobiales bacterium]